MGRWAEKKKKNTIKDEIYRRLSGMLREGMGRSRNEDKKNGEDQKYIYATRTYETYHRQAKLFANWCMQHHPEVKHLKDLKPYADEYILALIEEGKSAWTISTKKAAIAKTLGIRYEDMLAGPARERKNIVRSRGPAKRDAHISAELETKLAKLTSATGLRRRELSMITGDALCFASPSGEPQLNVVKGTKGGKPRTVRIVGSTPEETEEIVNIFKSAGKMRVLPKVPSAYDNHHYRAEYAKRLYNLIARPIAEIPKVDRYVMRKDRAGEILDKKAMMIVSKNLGHNRIDIIAGNYLYH